MNSHKNDETLHVSLCFMFAFAGNIKNKTKKKLFYSMLNSFINFEEGIQYPFFIQKEKKKQEKLLNE